jgi:hypothetical protein
MKRFICRTVESINCKVEDYMSLMGFVPYYSGAESHQSFERLKHELQVICHTGGKWVTPA